MCSRVIDDIVEALVSGDMDADDFMWAVQQRIEAHEVNACNPFAGATREVRQAESVRKLM